MKVIDQSLLDKVSAEAKESPRLRMNYNFHQSLDEILKISNLYDFVISHDIVVANNDLDYFLSSLILNYTISKRIKEQYSVYRFDAAKFDEEAGLGAEFDGGEG